MRPQVYISFPHAFWDEGPPPPSRPLPSPSSSTVSVGTSDADTASSDASTAASILHPAVTTFLPAYPPTGPEDLARPVTEEAMSLARLPAPHAHSQIQ